MEYILQNLPNMDEIDTIIEPYCGSFSLIRHLIDLYPDKKYICNDNNKKLIECYKYLQNEDNLKELITFYKDFEPKNKEEYNVFVKNGIKGFLFGNTIYNVRPFLYPLKQKKKMDETNFSKMKNFNKRYKNIEFTCYDAIDIINKYKNEQKCFIFCDPPFILECCGFYENSNQSSTNLLMLMEDFKNFKAKFLICNGYNFLLETYYANYGIKTKFQTQIKYQNHHKISFNKYVSNF